MLAMENCRRLFRHAVPWAAAFALESAGMSMPAKMAMMAMTTSSSMSVNARRVADEGWKLALERWSNFFMASGVLPQNERIPRH